MPRQVVRNYPDKCAKRKIICEYSHLGKICVKTSASTLEKALARVVPNITKYGASRVVIKDRKYDIVLASVEARQNRRTRSVWVSVHQ